MKSSIRLMLAATVFCTVWGSVAHAQTSSEAENEIRRMDAAWKDAINTKDLDKSIDFYDENAYAMVNNQAPIVGKQAIRKVWESAITAHGLQIKYWKPIHIDVAKSGDMAYDIGLYQYESIDANGKVILMPPGKYAVVWKKNAAGVWRVAVDAPTAVPKAEE